MLSPGQIVATEASGLRCVVREHLGGGGQGEVYRAELGDAEVALKWYAAGYLAHDPGLRERIATLVASGAPSERFLWPLDLASRDDLPSFGYVMPLRDPSYHGMSDVIARRVEPSFRAILTAAYELADGFLRLHAKGLAYRDISEGNVFVDVATGSIRICDNDNVGVNGAFSPIAGTWRYLAPEIGLRQASPNAQSDLWSLSVLLFLMLMLAHPLDGAREHRHRVLDATAVRALYAEHPVFVFDPDDDTNRPWPGRHDNAPVYWALYPAYLRDLFVRAFTIGIRDPGARVREGEWRAAMVRLRDALFSCASCGAECFTADDAATVCWSCGTTTERPLRLRFVRDVVAVSGETVLFPHHLDPARRYDFSTPLAVVAPHPRDARVFGLKNLSAATWTARSTSRSVVCAPGTTVRISAATSFDFGTSAAEVVT